MRRPCRALHVETRQFPSVQSQFRVRDHFESQPLRSCTKYPEFLGRLRNHFTPVRSEKYQILNSHAALARQINARFYRHYHSFFEYRLRVYVEAWGFMDFEAHTVPKAMAE